MVAPISGGTAFDFAAAAQTTAAQTEATTAPAATAKQPTKIEPASDTVRLSDRAQVHLLRTQGQTVAQIAISTALNAQTVDSYLGISPAALPPVAASNK
jgi:DNA-binding CsgD family transcriptional regulator